MKLSTLYYIMLTKNSNLSRCEIKWGSENYVYYLIVEEDKNMRIKMVANQFKIIDRKSAKKIQCINSS